MPIVETRPSEAEQFDPSSIVLPEQFDPSTLTGKTWGQTLAEEARGHINDHRAGGLDMSFGDSVQANLVAQEGKSAIRRAFDKAYAIPSRIAELYPARGETSPIAESVKKALSDEYQKVSAMSPLERIKYGFNLPHAMDVAGAGAVVKSVPGMLETTADAARVLDPKTAIMDVVAPQYSQQEQAQQNAVADMLTANTNKGVDLAVKASGVDTESLPVKIAEQVDPLLAMAAIPGGGMEGVEKGVADLSSKIVEGGARTMAKGGAIAAEGARKIAPKAVLAAEAAGGMMTGAHFGSHGIPLALGEAIAGMWTGKVLGIQKGVQGFLDAKLSDIAKVGRIVADAPEGMTKVEALQNVAQNELDKTQQQIGSLRSRLKPEESKLLDEQAPDGSPLHDEEDLPPAARKIRTKENKILDLQDKVDALEKQKRFARFKRDSAEYLTGLGINTGAGVGIGAGFAGATTPPGDTSTMGEGAVIGGAFGAMAGLRGAPKGSLRTEPIVPKAPKIAPESPPQLPNLQEAPPPTEVAPKPEVIPAPSEEPATPTQSEAVPSLQSVVIPQGEIKDAVKGLQALKISDPQGKIDAAVEAAQTKGIQADANDLLNYSFKGDFGAKELANQVDEIANSLRGKDQQLRDLGHTQAGIDAMDLANKERLIKQANEGGIPVQHAEFGQSGGYTAVEPQGLQNATISPPESPLSQEPTAATPERGVADVVPPPEQVQSASDYAAIRTEAENAKREELSDTKRKTKEAEIERAGLDAMAKEHAKTAADTDLLTFRTSRFGRESISGRKVDPSDPFHAQLLQEANLSPQATENLNALEANIGNTVAIDYTHAPELEEASGISRKVEQAASTAPERVAGKGAQRRLTKSFVPTNFTYNPPTKTFEVNGFSPDKFLSNAKLLIEWGKANKLKGYESVNDPKLVEDFNAMVENHKNGYTMLGKPIEGTPFTNVKPNPDFKPNIIPKDRVDLLNAMLGNEGAKIGVRKASPEKADKQILAQQNSPYWEPTTGETNKIRAMLGDEAKLLESTSETLRPELIERVRQENVSDEAILRPSGFKGERGAFTEKGTPRSDFSAAGFAVPVAGLAGLSLANQE